MKMVGAESIPARQKQQGIPNINIRFVNTDLEVNHDQLYIEASSQANSGSQVDLGSAHLENENGDETLGAATVAAGKSFPQHW